MMKVNSKSAFPDMFAREADGLATIRETQTIAVPEVVLQADIEDESFLILEWIESVSATPVSSKLLGQQLADMHRHTSPQFGLEYHNYMGSIPQSNRRHDTWAMFFINERLQPMVKIAVDKGLLNRTDAQQFEKLFLNISGLFNEEPPALIHGDLWGGNYLISRQGEPYLIDPAVSYGHREFDIAMTNLFGGFGSDFYHHYNESFPLTKGWQQRINLWNLYPLLLHLNLFGTSYLAQVKSCLAEYI